DSLLFALAVRALAALPILWRIPLVEATSEIISAVEAQIDFRLEADRHSRFWRVFENGRPVRIPRLLSEFCTQEMLVMEYFPRLKRITSPDLKAVVHSNAVFAGLQALY